MPDKKADYVGNNESRDKTDLSRCNETIVISYLYSIQESQDVTIIISSTLILIIAGKIKTFFFFYIRF